MKSRPSKPSPSPSTMRRFRIDSTRFKSHPAASNDSSPQDTYKASFRVDELPPIAMNGFQPFGTPSNNVLLTPIHNNVRRMSGDHSPSRPIDTSPSPSNRAVRGTSPHLSPSSDQGVGGWSSAVGHATTGGKSGRVIEKLMTENDKLKRELNEQVTRAEELQRNLQMYKPKIEALQTENDNLSHARGVDSALISRRDRKIEELKTDLQQERQRREAYEQRARQMERERDEAIEEKRRDVQSLTESTKHATLHAQILETSHKQLSTEYRTRLEASRKELTTLQDEREEDRRHLARLDIVMEQMRSESERAKKMQTETVARWTELKDATGERLTKMEAASAQENERLHHLSTDMDVVVKEMRWLMGVKRHVNFSDADRPQNLPPTPTTPRPRTQPVAR